MVQGGGGRNGSERGKSLLDFCRDTQLLIESLHNQILQDAQEAKSIVALINAV